MEVTGHDPYICEIANKGVRYDGNRGRLYKIPDGATGIYCKSFDGSITTNLVTFYDENKISLNFFSLPFDGEKYVGIPSDARYISIRIGKSDGVAGQTYKDRIMVSFSPIKEWTPLFYGEVPANIILRSCITGEKDEYLGDGKILRRCKEISTTDESIQIIPGEYISWRLAIPVKDAIKIQGDTRTIGVYCTHGFYKGEERGPGVAFYFGTNNEIIIYCPERISSVQEALNWARTNDIRVIYPLETPVIETLDPILIETKAPYGYCTNDSKIDTEIEWEILTKSNSDAQLADLEKRISALEKALLE